MAKPKILIDTREKNLELLNQLLDKPEGVEISMKSGGSGDYIIVDKNGGLWGIERKEFLELYQKILEKDADGKSSRVYGQLAQLKKEYKNRAILMVHEFKPLPWEIKHKEDIIKRTVYTFFSERSFAMPTLMVKDEKHAAHVLKKLAKQLPNVEFYGRGYKVIKIE